MRTDTVPTVHTGAPRAPTLQRGVVESRWRSIWFYCSTFALALGGVALIAGSVFRDLRPGPRAGEVSAVVEPDADQAADVDAGTVAATIHHVGAASETFDGATDAFIADIEQYWRATLPAATGTRYDPLVGGVWPASADAPLPGCGASSADTVVYNAFYCSGADFIAYDDRGLFADMASYFGVGSLGVVLAHEWGHAIQIRVGDPDLAPVVMELQADCFAGAWAQDAVRRGGIGTFLTPENLHQALGAVILLGDAEGSTSTDAGAHGSGFDRIASFLDGYQRGIERCFSYVETPPATFQLPWGTYEEYVLGGDLPLDALLDGAAASLTAFLETRGGGQPVVRTGDGSPCVLEQIAAWCDEQSAVVVDASRAQQVLDDVGDMAIGYSIAEAYFDHAGDSCGAAQWVAWMQSASDPESASRFTLSPGDLEEAVLYLLYFSPNAPTGLDAAIETLAAFQAVVRSGTCR